jgi:hypothetical protein
VSKKNKIKIEIDEDINFNIKDLKMEQIIPNVIDDYLITIYDDHHTIIMPPNITGIQFKIWSQGRGGVFSKDVLHHTLNKNNSKYILIKSKDLHCIARIISEDEKSLFESLKLIDGKLKDTSYMILRNLKNGDKLTNVNKYIEEKDIVNEEDMRISILDTQKISHDEDLDNYHVESISLFTE